MPIAVWTPNLSLGVPSLDADHRKLIDTMNQVFDALMFDRSSAMIHAALATLNDYVVEHFAREEAWMRERNHPDLHRHLQEHEALCTQLAALRLARHVGPGALGRAPDGSARLVAGSHCPLGSRRRRAGGRRAVAVLINLKPF